MEVIRRDKSSWQKNDCLFCLEDARYEMVYGNANIRCCENEACQENARSTARKLGEITVKKTSTKDKEDGGIPSLFT